MITVYTIVNERLEPGGIESLSPAAVWIDLLQPSTEEEDAVERLLRLDVPTREEMQEIEASSRLYREDGGVYVTVPVVTNSDTPEPITVAVTFILTALCTITVRYGDPKPFRLFAARATRQRGLALSSEAVLMGLLEGIVDRAADLFETIGGELDRLSQHIFNAPTASHRRRRQNSADLQGILRGIGRNGDLASKVSDSLLGVARATTYLSQDDAVRRKDCKARLKTMTRDVRSLTEHGTYTSSKITFLLDATLGMINIQQNNIIKIFSVVAVIFLPPTLVASLYGMNYKYMPELEWEYGYLWALCLMVLSAVLPYLYFKRKGWL